MQFYNKNSLGSADDLSRSDKLASLAPALLPWFAENGRKLPWRTAPSPYHVWISEIMLQQTRIEAVKSYYARFLEALPDIASLAAAESDRLMKLWEGLGYYSRVRNLQAAAKLIVSEFGGEFPRTFDSIRSLPGIGDYTAGAIASICFDQPVPAVDGNVLRVLARITGDSRPVTDEKTKSSVREELRVFYPKTGCGAFTQALMELGEVICVPNGIPNCACCPCRAFCTSENGDWEKYPVRQPKKSRRMEKLTVFLLSCGGLCAVRRRGETGLLSGMWEFPNVPGSLSPTEAREHAETWGLLPSEISKGDVYRHVFTHVEWEMHVYHAECNRRSEEFYWVDSDTLRDRISLPTAFRKLMPKRK